MLIKFTLEISSNFICIFAIKMAEELRNSEECMIAVMGRRKVKQETLCTK